MDLSRRAFLLNGTGLAAAVGPLTATEPRWPARPRGPAPAPGVLTAGGVVDRIKSHVGIPWRAETVDRIVAGAPDTRVDGIATTMMATLDVLKRAAAAGRNMVITHEPTFYSHEDRLDGLRDDATYRFKADFIRRHEMVVFHFHDHWHRRDPDGIAVGMTRALGWQDHLVPSSQREFAFAGRPLGELVGELQSRLGAHMIRVVGDPALQVSRALASWGYVSRVPGIPYLARPDIDVLIVGEAREWELVEYVQDQIASGRKKALIVLGHVVSEQAGMEYCAEWLRSFVSEVPIELIAAAEPFWQPA